MSLGKIRTLTTFPTGDPAFDRYQQHVKQQLTPVLENPLLSAVDFRWNEIAGVAPAAPTFALQYRSGSTWNTVATFDSAGQIAQLVWTAVAVFANSWVNFGAPWAVASYMKDSLGFVHLRGLIKSGVIGSAAFTLPSGYIPHDRQMFACVDGANTGQRLDVTEGGLVIPTSGNNGNFSLSGITFDTRS